MALNSGVLAEKRRIRMDKPVKKEGYGQKKAPHREPIRRGNHEIIMVPLLGGNGRSEGSAHHTLQSVTTRKKVLIENEYFKIG